MAIVNVIIIEDDPVAVKGMKMVFGDTSKFRISGEAATESAAESAIFSATKLEGQVLFLMDMSLTGHTGTEGLALTRKIRVLNHKFEMKPLVVCTTVADTFPEEMLSLDVEFVPKYPRDLSEWINRYDEKSRKVEDFVAGH